jgi:dGTPase
VALPDDIFNALYGLRSFLFKNIYNGEHLKEERDKAKFLLGQLYDYYLKKIEEMPELYQKIAEEEGKERAVADYIAGMTDDYAIILFNQIFVPKIVIY